MYNRYIPQPDGSYRRNQVPDGFNPPQRHPQRRPSPPPQAPSPEPERCEEPACPKQACSNSNHRPPAFQPRYNTQKDPGIGNFLKQLLPQNLGTEDLLIVLLLLLMSGDCAEDRNTALLTLAIYLFL